MEEKVNQHATKSLPRFIRGDYIIIKGGTK